MWCIFEQKSFLSTIKNLILDSVVIVAFKRNLDFLWLINKIIGIVCRFISGNIKTHVNNFNVNRLAKF
jgi:hypothetical protein